MNSAFTLSKGLQVNDHTLEFYLMACFLFFLPFSQALTIPLFFSLKISEVALILCIGLKIVKIRNVKLPISTLFLLLYSFLVIVFISVLVNSFSTYSYTLDTKWARLSPLGDSVFKFIYLILAVFCTVISYKELKKNIGLLEYFFLGTTIACIYCWYMFFSGLLHIPVIKLPGMEAQPQWMPLSFATIIRCGTAKEGNFMALFLFIAGIIASHFNKRKLGVLYFCSILTTFSTVAIVCTLLYFILVTAYNKNISKLKVAILMIGIMTSIIIAGAVSSDFRSLVINKIIGTTETVDNQNDILSKLDRLNSADVGIEIFKDNLIWGVGTANYGLHYDHYNQLPEFDSRFKRIPNNIYVEILCESGILALVLFMLIFIYAFKLMKGDRFIHLKSGIVITLIYFLAFPTYTMLFIWMFIAVILVESKAVSRVRNV